jgi:hypothetical protein
MQETVDRDEQPQTHRTSYCASSHALTAQGNVQIPRQIHHVASAIFIVRLGPHPEPPERLHPSDDYENRQHGDRDKADHPHDEPTTFSDAEKQVFSRHT